MRRRVREPLPGEAVVPAELLHYDPADWIGRGCHPPCAFWQAHSAWTDEHGADSWPSVIAEGPDVPWHSEWGA